MKYLIAALLLSVSAPAFADNIAGCEVVLMERIAQEGLEGSAEVASFRPAADFIASIYDEESEVMREIDGLPIRAIMCKRKSVIPGLRDFPIVATGTPFMISQNFESTESGLTTIYFKDGEFRSNYKGPDLDEDTAAELADRLDVFNLQPHDLAEKERAMLEKQSEAEDKDVETADNEAEDADTDEAKEPAVEEDAETSEKMPKEENESKSEETPSTEEPENTDDSETESAEEDPTPQDDDMTENDMKESGEDEEKPE